MKRALLPLALVAPLALAACDDGSDRITELERELETQRASVETGANDLTALRTELDTANARVVELEAAGTDTTELDTANARIAELESASADITTMEKELETANARIVELEAAAPTDAPAADAVTTTAAADLSEPMNDLLQSLREHQAALVDLQATVIDDPSARALADAALKNMRVIGRDLQQAAAAAGVEIQ